jgi:hypothetical protein
MALAFAGYLMGGGDVEESVVAAANLGRDAEDRARDYFRSYANAIPRRAT